MTWRELIVARILLLVAQMFADDSELADEIKSLATHLQVTGRNPGVESPLPKPRTAPPRPW